MSETVTLATGKIIPMCRTLPDDENFYRIYDDYITQVYERFNGVINKKKTKKLVIPDISMCPRDIYTHGEYLKGTVSIYSANIIKTLFDAPESIILNNLFVDVLHELKHSDYITDLVRYHDNYQYRNRLEMLVNYNTFKFIYENKEGVNKVYNDIRTDDFLSRLKRIQRVNQRLKKPIDFEKGIW